MGIMIYGLIAAVAFGVSWAWRKSVWRTSSAYRFVWLVVMCVFWRHQFYVWDLQANFRDIGGPDGGFAGMALGFMTLYSLPCTAAGFLLTFLWPKDGRLLHWSSWLVVTLIMGAWAGGSWIKQQKFGRNVPYDHPLVVVDQHGNPVAGVQMAFEIRKDKELFFEVPKLIASVDGKRSLRSNVMMTSDVAGKFHLPVTRAEQVICWGMTLPDNYLAYAHPGHEQVSPGHTFRLLKTGTGETNLQVRILLRVEESAHDFAINLLSTEPGAERTALPDLLVKLRDVVPNDPARKLERELTLAVPDGGLVETGEQQPFRAPEKGYQPHVAIRFRPDDLSQGNWRRKFYSQSRRGRVWTALDVQFTLFPYAIAISAVVNPYGSRNLEPDPDKQITDPEEIRRLDEATQVK